jgi:hypothetical protein
MPVAKLDITLDEFATWVAFERVNPFPDQVNEYQLAQIALLLYSQHSKNKLSITDFMLSELVNKPTRENTNDIGDVIWDALGSLTKK